MADRTVRVRLIADTAGFLAEMRAAGGAATAFGRDAAAAGRGTRGLSAEAAAARAALSGVGAGARGGASGVRTVGTEATGASRGLRSATGDATRMGAAFSRVGGMARSGFASVRGAASSALAPMKSMGTLLAGGAIVYGIHDIVEAGNEYTSAMQKYGEVTRASGAQLAAAGQEAQRLGSDVRLPAASAAEAAEAMVELSKAGLSASDSMKAARGTLQLSAAARTDVSQAAKVEGDIMDQFSLKSTQATMVADTLANAVNNSSGELIDMYYAMKYVGPTAHSMGVSIQDTATAVGLLGKSGIIGETAGTTLRGMLVNLAKPTDNARKGLRTLGIQAFDSEGKFKGLQYVITQLATAHEHLTQQQFTSAAAMAFGKPALSGATALAHQGGAAFEALATQVGRVGGAASLAAAESKGLGGAMKTLGAQVKAGFLQVYLAIAPGLEKVARGMASGVQSAIPYLKRGIKTAADLWDIYGPTVEAKFSSAGGQLENAAEQLGRPIGAALVGGATASLPVLIASLHNVYKILSNGAAAEAPVVSGLHDLFTSVGSSAGALGIFNARLAAGVSIVGDMSGVLRPVGTLVGGLAHAFAELPGPIQLSVLSMLALRPFRGQIQGLQQSVVGFGRGAVNAFRGIGDAALYQRVQAAQAGVTLGTFGGIVAELETRSPLLAQMGTAFRSTAGAIQAAGGRAVGFRSILRGIGSAAGSGVMSGLKGLISFLGGPWGIAMGAAMIGLDLLAKHQQEAAQAAAEHQQRISTLTQALQRSNGVTTASVRQTAVQTLADTKLADGKTELISVMDKAGVNATQLTNAYLGQGTSVEALRARLQKAADATKTYKQVGAQVVTQLSPQGRAYAAAAAALGSVSGEMSTAKARAKELAAAEKTHSTAASDATNPTTRLKDAISTLGKSSSDADTKARALHDALTLLSGGELDVQAAVANMNESITQLNQTWSGSVDHAKGWRNSMLQADGSLNTTKENAQTLFNQLQSLNEQTASAAQATYDYARANGDSAAPALKKAEARMQTAYDAAVKAGRGFGLSTAQAQRLANTMGFIPSSLAITMKTPGLSQTEKDLLYVQGLAGHMPKGSTITVSALTADATKQIEALGFKVKTLPGGRQMVISAPTKKAAAALDALIAKKIPDKVVGVSAATSDAIRDLQAVQDKVKATKGKSFTMSALTSDARKALEDLGYRIRGTKGKSVSITAPTGTAQSQVAAIQRSINGLRGKTVRNWVYTNYVQLPAKGANLKAITKQNGGLVDRYADGGVRHFAAGGETHVAQIARAGTWRVWAEDETGGEAYIPLARSKRPRSRKIAEETVRRLGGKGIAWNADGGLNGWTYTPTGSAVLGGTGDAQTRYDTNVQKLKDAWKTLDTAVSDAKKKATALTDAEKNLSRVRKGHHTAAQLRAAQEKVDKAKSAKKTADKTVSTDRKAVNSADTALGLKKGAHAPSGFSLTAYEKQLSASTAATTKWRNNLAKIAKKGGDDVRDMLQDMGTDGYSLVNALAGASTKQFNQIVAQLKKVSGVAQATLADYTSQLTGATKVNAQFASDLEALASKGYGDLAQALGAQGDSNAQALAHQAATGSAADVSKANAAVKAGKTTLTGDDLTNALIVLTALRSKPGAGIADVETAGVDYATLQALVPKMLAQITKLPDAYTATFLQQWAGQGVTAMARGGILTSPTVVLGGEAGVPESWIPHDGSSRSRALLARTATAMGYHLTPVRAAAGGQAPVVQHVTKHYEVTLNGAGQTTAEQATDIVRHMAFVG